MATPKIFISSTCYDLIQIRDSLFDFVKSYYYEPVLSEKGDVFFHPDLHTHESCLNEVENCQLFILIIGGRFGGNYIWDSEKSVTNAEYEVARLKKIPVFTFIKREVYEDHRLYQKNKHDIELVKKITFPSIEKQDYAIKIFEFIDKVRMSEVNNSYCPFEYVSQIRDNLGKQWAGLMFDFLNNRLKNKDQQVVNQTLDNLTLINRKTEELVESIYRQLKPNEAVLEIENANRVMNGSKFYSRVFRLYNIKKFSLPFDKIARIDTKSHEWYEYLVETKDFELVKSIGVDFISNEYNDVTLWLKLKVEECYWAVVRESDRYEPEIMEIMELYKLLKKLKREERKKAIEITTANIT